MRLRSLLFVPGDRPERIKKALDLDVDALIFDLEDSVVIDRKVDARRHISTILGQPRHHQRLFVRINQSDCLLQTDDLNMLTLAAPDGIVLPKAEGAVSVNRLSEKLGHHGIHGIGILPIATETPSAIFELGTYRDVAKDLIALTWGAEDLPAAIGALTARDENQSYTPPYEFARSLTLFAAAAAGVLAIETVYPDFNNLEGLKKYVLRAARDGFSGMMAIHPLQVQIINSAFTPTLEAVVQAQKIVAAFEENPNIGALKLDGKMIDAPHLKAALRVLAMAG